MLRSASQAMPRVPRFRGFGYALLDGGSTRRLDELLRAVADAGYSHAELDPRGWDVWLGGNVNAHELARWTRVLDAHRERLAFTMHGPLEANLFDRDRSVHASLLRAALEVAGALGAEVAVIHPGRRAAGSSVPLVELMAAERDVLAALGAQAEEWGGRVAVETWYSADALPYSYAIWPDQLAAQIEGVAHPAVGVCLDFSHVFLAAEWFGFDFLDGVRKLAPLAKHLHVQDTFGLARDVEVPALGYGDLHLPPGWGRVPLAEAFAAGDFVHEPIVMVELLADRFLPQLAAALESARALART
jgi:sugar phosphate isomerase/epimerase